MRIIDWSADGCLSDLECSFGDGFYQSLLNDSPVGCALVSTDGRWLRVNRAISRLLGYSPEELSRLNFQKLTHPDDLEADLQLVDDLIAGRRENYRLEKRYVRDRKGVREGKRGS